MAEQPPYYILYAHSSLQATSNPSSTALSHPVIEYRFADDSPRSLLPRHPDEHVIVLQYDTSATINPTLHSTSSVLAATAVKCVAARGAGADDEIAKNENMYILDLTSPSDDS
ncbi:hypothetical protein CONPUDRAFT_46734 [Coniophora puteana RWD-64-598 SS2]|uniref:Uncharacterized protein n=1 Tax=Coniophora puteana (strain RWD-64-598) TaxID=741705 RepID=A0A5M3N6T3_CONPW|nr:uncharacterized protein CONPUDRAFT_46734 [Coniophora puteana RWD-64-598 SS2]EIW86555.1 hypothetical protein CONPUDRAFT_46734 [Coniophora puteana RWD-64-598 SS2]